MQTFQDLVIVQLGRSLARPQTVQGYHTSLAHLMPRLGQLAVTEITEGHVLEALADCRAKGLAERTLSHIVKAARMVLRRGGSAAADGIRLRPPDPDVRPWSAAHAEAVRAVLRPGEPADDMVLALLGSGLRLAELERLREQDWDAARGILTVGTADGAATKSGRTRSVDVAGYAWAAVVRVIEDGPVPRRTLRRRLDRIAQEAGVPRIRVHDLRHTRLTLLLLAGAPVLYVSAQAGHHGPAYTMQVYGHLVVASPDQRRRWADSA